MTNDDQTRLKQIVEKIKSNDRGKIIQILLAITFVKINMGKVSNQISEGIDIIITNCNDGFTYYIEVKTSTSGQFNISEDECCRLKELSNDPKNKVYVAALRINNFEDWIFVPMKFIKSGGNDFNLLINRADASMLQKVSVIFTETLKNYFHTIIVKRRDALCFMLEELKRLNTINL